METSTDLIKELLLTIEKRKESNTTPDEMKGMAAMCNSINNAVKTKLMYQKHMGFKRIIDFLE